MLTSLKDIEINYGFEDYQDLFSFPFSFGSTEKYLTIGVFMVYKLQAQCILQIKKNEVDTKN